MLPNTNTLDYIYKGLPLDPYKLIGNQSFNTTLLDNVDYALPHKTLYKTYRVNSSAIRTILESIVQKDTAAISTILESTGSYILPIARDGDVVTDSNNGGDLTTPVTVSLHPNQVLVVRYFGSKGQGDATQISFNGRQLTKLVSEFSEWDDGVSIWMLLSPPVGTFDLEVVTENVGDKTAVIIDRLYNVRQTYDVATVFNQDQSSPPNTDTLNAVDDGLPYKYPYRLFGSQEFDTGLLDNVDRALPMQGLYHSSTDSITGELDIIPESAGSYILDAINADSFVTTDDEDYSDEYIGGSHIYQAGEPEEETFSWDIAEGGRWEHVAIALEHATHPQNKVAIITTLSKPGKVNSALLTILEGISFDQFGINTRLETSYKNYAIAGQLGGMIGITVDLPNGVGITTILQTKPLKKNTAIKTILESAPVLNTIAFTTFFILPPIRTVYVAIRSLKSLITIKKL